MNGNPFYIEPAGDYGGQLAGLGQAIQAVGAKREEEQKVKAAKDRFLKIQNEAVEAYRSNDPSQMAEFSLKNPEWGESMKLAIGFKDERTEAAMADAYRNIMADPDNAEEILIGGIKRVDALGGRPDAMITDLGMYRRNPEAALKSIKMAYAGFDPEGWSALQKARGSGGPDIGKYNPRDYTVASFAEFRKSGDPGVLERYTEKTIDVGGVPHRLVPGTTNEYEPITTTEEVAASEAVIAGTKEASTQAIKESQKAFERIGPIRQNIANYDEVIRLVDEGAGTGVIESRLPSFQDASIQLDNLQGQLGLDVVGQTTFGALSGPELQFALDTALPVGLEGEALKDWVSRKKASQQKLLSYLQRAATYLGTPGNTISGFLEAQRMESLENSADQNIDDLVNKYAN